MGPKGNLRATEIRIKGAVFECFVGLDSNWGPKGIHKDCLKGLYGRRNSGVIIDQAGTEASSSIHPVEDAYSVEREMVEADDIIKVTRQRR